MPPLQMDCVSDETCGIIKKECRAACDRPYNVDRRTVKKLEFDGVQDA